MTKPSLSILLSRGIKSLIALGGLLALLLWSSDYFMTRSIISDVYRDFYGYTRENPVDVLILGTSHGQAGINTVRLSEKLEASVYTLAVPAQGIGQTYYTLKDALRHTKPKMVIIDSYFAGQADIMKDREYFAYEQLHAMDSLDVRAAYLADLVPFLNWFDAVFPVINEHENWKQPTAMQRNTFFNLGASTEKNRHINGFLPNTSIMTGETLQKISTLEMKPLEPLPRASKDYVRKIVELCRDEGIEPVFIQVPLLPQYVAKVGYETRNGEMAQLLSGLDATWLNWNDESIGMESDSFRDESSDIGNNHLNIKGANIYTGILGDALSDRYRDLLKQGSHQVIHEPQQMLRFLSTLKKSELVFMTVNDDASSGWLPHEVDKLHQLNLTQLPVDMPGQCYSAIFTGEGTVLWEKSQPDRIDQAFKKGVTLSGLSMPVNARITSAGLPASEGRVFINGQDFSMNIRGLNFVVYDMELKKVTRVELFDLYDRSLYLKDLMAE